MVDPLKKSKYRQEQDVRSVFTDVKEGRATFQVYIFQVL